MGDNKDGMTPNPSRDGDVRTGMKPDPKPSREEEKGG